MRLAALAILSLAAPAAAQQPGAYLVYGEEDGAAFVHWPEDGEADGAVPLEFHYFRDSEPAGAAIMAGRPDCAAGIVSTRLTHANGEPVPPEQAAMMPEVAFERADEDGGAVVVDFLCGDAAARSAIAPGPITRPVAEAAAAYVALRRLGLAHGEAARLASTGATLGENAGP